MKKAIVTLLSGMLLLSACGNSAEQASGKSETAAVQTASAAAENTAVSEKTDRDPNENMQDKPAASSETSESSTASADDADAVAVSDDTSIDEASTEDAPADDTSADNSSANASVNVIWSGVYGWAFGGDFVYIDQFGNLYEESECEQPDFEPLGACKETFTGEHFTKDELIEFLKIDPDDEASQIDMLHKKGLWFGRLKGIGE